MKLKQYFCKHRPYPFRSLTDSSFMVCEKCGLNYQKKSTLQELKELRQAIDELIKVIIEQTKKDFESIKNLFKRSK